MLVAALLLLAAFYGLAWYARRAGWLDRWMGGRRIEPGGNMAKLAVMERRAISRKTVIYRISDGEQEYLLVESSASIGLARSGKHA